MLIVNASQTHDSLTLREIKESSFEIVFQCDQCGTKQNLTLADLMVTHGQETRLGYVRRNTVCNRCTP